ncbi:MAG: hypothetical protein DME25_04270, partial [Verrucomicrobia bacterium]
MYYEGTRSFAKLSARTGTGAALNGWGANSVLLKQFDRWFLGVVVATGVGGVGFLGGTLIGVGFWRRTWAKRLQATEDQWRRTATAFQSQLADSRQAQDRLEKAHAQTQREAAELSHAKEQLQAELGQLKRTEKNLSQQRQVLESSKTVLELHVQERTRELQKLQRRYELILNSAGEGICGLDQAGRATFVNPAVASLTGWSVAELIGKTEQEIFGCHAGSVQAGSTDGREEVARPAGSGQDGGACGHGGEQVFHRKDGSCFPVELVKTPIAENGQALGAVLVFKDITERKRVEEAVGRKAAELARSNAELEQFAFVASHDLQEPLRKIQAFGDRLKTKCQGAIAAEAHDYLERMQSAAARMRTLINDLLAFSRAIRSNEPFVTVDLAALAKEVVGDVEVRIEKSGA